MVLAGKGVVIGGIPCRIGGDNATWMDSAGTGLMKKRENAL
jgi:hypothetical protein